jgi:hypothetical protein
VRAWVVWPRRQMTVLFTRSPRVDRSAPDSERTRGQRCKVVGIHTDTTASIPPTQLIQELGIEIVRYYVRRGLKTLRGMVDIGPVDFAEWLASAGTSRWLNCERRWRSVSSAWRPS